jgi:hypothetical protein
MASKAPRKKKSIDFSKPVGNVLNPYLMTKEERQSEVSEIMAMGVARIQNKKTPRQVEHQKRVASQKPNQPRDLLTEDMLAERWLCSASRLQRWRVEGQGIPYLKIGARVLYRLKDIEAYEESCLIRPHPDTNASGFFFKK